MSRRIDIELTSSRPDGTWTWRAAGAREPKGVVPSSLLPADARVGQVLKAEAEADLDGLTITSVTDPKSRSPRSGLLELIPSEKPFEAVTQQLARKERSDRPGRNRPRGDRPDRGDRPRGDRQDRGPRSDRPERGERPGGERPRGERRDRPDGSRPPRRERPNFTPPPELPQRPKAKRLKPGRTHRNAVLAELPEAQRPVAERALQGGIPAVRQAINEQNTERRAQGLDEVPAAGLLAMAEQLLPKLRVAEWLDRADAAKAVIDDLDLRDLRSGVAAGEDPLVARDESTRALAAELKQALATKQDKEMRLWLEDIDAAVGVGRVVRALKLSSQPPKAGTPFPAELAKRLADATGASLTSDAPAERWIAVLEAAAFSPVRTQVAAVGAPAAPGEELLSTVRRLAPLLPQVATMFGIEVAEGAAAPKPLRPARPGQGGAAKKPAPARTHSGAPARPRPDTPASDAAPTETAQPETAQPAEDVASHSDVAATTDNDNDTGAPTSVDVESSGDAPGDETEVASSDDE